MKASSLFAVPLAIFADRLPGSSVSSAETLLHSQAICNFDTIFVANIPGLSVDDLHSVPRTSAFAQQFNQAAVHSISSSYELDNIVSSISQRCARQVVTSMGESKGNIVSLLMPNVEDEQLSYRKDTVSSTLDPIVKQVTSGSSSFVVIIMGASTPSNPKLSIQHRSLVDSPFFSPELRASKNSTLSHSKGLLHEYQFLTPGLLLTTIVALLVLFPILWFGLTALSSIEIPSGMGNIAKTEKKV